MKNQILRMLTGTLAFLASGVALADELNMRVGVTDISRQVYDLHMTIFYICVAIGVVVFSVLFWSVFQHRKSKGAVAATFHDSTKLELAWTIVPTLILIVMAIPATQVLVAMYDTGGEDMNIEVRGYQWKWQYKYLDEDYNNSFSFFSNLATPKSQIVNRSAKTDTYLLEVDEHLRIPINRKVRFLVTSEDVIHAWCRIRCMVCNQGDFRGCAPRKHEQNLYSRRANGARRSNLRHLLFFMSHGERRRRATRISSHCQVTCCLRPTGRSLKLSNQRRVRQCNASVWQAA